MRRKTFIYWFIGGLLMCAIFYGCYKKKTKNPGQEIALLRSIYEEFGKRHNDFLARSFAGIKTKLTARRQARTTSPITQDEMLELVLQESSINLVPVWGSMYDVTQVFYAISKKLPADLTLLSYNSTAACIADNGGTNLSSVFIRSLDELDQLLDKCRNYKDSTTLLPEFERLLNWYAPLLINPVEREAFIAGATVGKYSFRYWAENERRIIDMLVEGLSPTDINKSSPVKADVRGMITGAIAGTVSGGIWGTAIPGIGTVCGVIAGGVAGALATGCVGSLAAELWKLFF